MQSIEFGWPVYSDVHFGDTHSTSGSCALFNKCKCECKCKQSSSTKWLISPSVPNQ